MLIAFYFATLALTLVGLAHGSPVVNRQSNPSPPTQYHLKTQLYDVDNTGDCGSAKGGLWLYCKLRPDDFAYREN